MEEAAAAAVSPPPPPPPRDQGAANADYEDKTYFDEYGKLGIHCIMLKDANRTEGYWKAISQNPQDFKDKVVLDVGSGTGVLSMFCAKMGAKRVYAVEASDMYLWSELCVTKNNLGHIVKIIHGRMEDVNIPEPVDVIVSEWMGSFLIFESMIDSVIYARDNYLKAGGKMYPAYANIYVAPISHNKFFTKSLHFLRGVCGLDLSPLIPLAAEESTASCVRCRLVHPEEVIADGHIIKKLDMATVKTTDYDRFIAPFECAAIKDDNVHGFALWFDVTFPAPADEEHEDVVLSTSPFSPKTHWRQDVFLLSKGIKVSEGDKITGLVRFTQNYTWKRHYDIEVSFDCHGEQYYKLWNS